jgi:hydrogenase maturation protein HypF
MNKSRSIEIKITGIVQGVGFRPFVYGLATQLALKGWVRNTSAGVFIEVDGNEDSLFEFVEALKHPPPLAKIDSIQVQKKDPKGFESFEIVHSEPIPGAYIPISPDVSTCEDCLRDMVDPLDKRYHYPFINCTNCGPRFTIIADIPYDRPKTTMAGFKMCSYCQKEYKNPLNRRFHAQPIACPECGPHVWFEEKCQSPKAYLQGDGIRQTQKFIKAGKIVGIKGLGGFHLACDATNHGAVEELRRRKLRIEKPFAVIFQDIDSVSQHCSMNIRERDLLLSRERPIVLLKRKLESNIATSVAPNQNTLGVMLPYTPLHALLFSNPNHIGGNNNGIPADSLIPSAIVLTSGNLSEEPIAFTNTDARENLADLVDGFLMHNRDIQVRCDDSVIRDLDLTKTQSANQNNSESKYFLRRSRGYAPNPIRIPFGGVQVLATGPELKNTFCFTKDKYAFISHHIGDLENFDTLQSFEDGISHYENLFRVEPEAIACDLHPNYLSTRYAVERAKATSKPLLQIQHHHAHAAACMVDNGLIGDHPVIGISFDGTGYGPDGAIWGGEFLIADYFGYERFAHLEYSPLPGGDAAIRKPYRTALAQLWHNDIKWDDDLFPVIAACGDDMAMLRTMLENEISTPKTSSIGRLFDAIASLAGVRNKVNYEGQAAIEFENLADPKENGNYFLGINKPSETAQGQKLLTIGTGVLYNSVVEDIRNGVEIPTISAKFHNGLANVTLEVCKLARAAYGINEVVLSGGVWQNMILLRKTIQILENDRFSVYVHRQVPTNDGGLSLGQAIIAIKTLGKG